MNKKRWILVGAVAALLLVVFVGRGLFTSNEADYTYWEPVLSPDGSMIVYESVTELSLELFTMDLGTQAVTQLTNDEYANWSPSWSPDGNRVAFASSRDKNVDIFVLDVHTLEITRLTSHSGDDINPSWGIDGAIYFNSNRSETWEAYSIDPDSFVLRKLTSLDATSP
ncbi:DPP IV N-terminal domain-containing protein [Candidatus Bipolaricaulota bacterium]|nr:DPP IV N-terminal domain-containing protein [Candidatus Bipolaricaulota bacterium]